jgi:hypothetical protein
MPATSHEDHRRSGVVPGFNRMELDGGVVDVGDPRNPTRHGPTDLVMLRLVGAGGVEVGRSGRVERQDNPTRQDRLGSVGSVVGRSGPWNPEGRRRRRKGLCRCAGKSHEKADPREGHPSNRAETCRVHTRFSRQNPARAPTRQPRGILIGSGALTRRSLQPDEIKPRQKAVHDRHDDITFRHGQRTTPQEVILEIDKNEGCHISHPKAETAIAEFLLLPFIEAVEAGGAEGDVLLQFPGVHQQAGREDLLAEITLIERDPAGNSSNPMGSCRTFPRNRLSAVSRIRGWSKARLGTSPTRNQAPSSAVPSRANKISPIPDKG